MRISSPRILSAAVSLAAIAAVPAAAQNIPNLPNLVGARAAGAMSELDRRGFEQVDNFTSGSTRYSIRWRERSRQCLQVTIADGRIYDIRDIGRHPRCVSSYGGSQSGEYGDLIGSRASRAIDRLERRGFERVDDFTSGSTRYNIMWRERSRDCLQVTITNGRVYDIDNIGRHRRCNSQGSSTPDRPADNPNAERINWYPRLVGGNAGSARTQLRQSGFVRMTRQGGGEGSIWYNRLSRQCLQLTVSDGRVLAAEDIGRSRQCR